MHSNGFLKLKPSLDTASTSDKWDFENCDYWDAVKQGVDENDLHFQEEAQGSEAFDLDEDSLDLEDLDDMF